MAADRIAGDERALHQIDVAEDRGEQVVEVVRDAAGETPDRLHLLRLRELRLERPPFGRVLDQQLENLGAAGLGRLEAAADANRDGRVVAARPVRVGAQHPAGMPDAIDEREKGDRIVVDLVGKADAHQAVDRRRAEQLREGRVGIEDDAVDAASADAVDGVFDHGAVTSFGGLQRDLTGGGFARSQPQQHHLGVTSRLAGHAHALAAHVQRAPIGREHRETVADDGLAGETDGEIAAQAIRRLHQRRERRSGRDAEERKVGAALVGGEHLALQVDERHGLGQGTREHEKCFRCHAPWPGRGFLLRSRATQYTRADAPEARATRRASGGRLGDGVVHRLVGQRVGPGVEAAGHVFEDDAANPRGEAGRFLV